ncbi:MAG: hypothetical protein JWM10_5447 [Myxococcaceae bacterium]|nr:hypothetical protein [Myxococcaceae bacterium]
MTTAPDARDIASMKSSLMLAPALGALLLGCGDAADSTPDPGVTRVAINSAAFANARVTMAGHDVVLSALGNAALELRPAVQNSDFALTVSSAGTTETIPPVCLPGYEPTPDPITDVQLDLRRRASDGACVVITRVVHWRSGRTFNAPWNDVDYTDAPCGAFATR